MRGAEFPSDLKAAVPGTNHDQLLGLIQFGELERVQADGSGADHDDRVARPDAGGLRGMASVARRLDVRRLNQADVVNRVHHPRWHDYILGEAAIYGRADFIVVFAAEGLAVHAGVATQNIFYNVRRTIRRRSPD